MVDVEEQCLRYASRGDGTEQNSPEGVLPLWCDALGDERLHRVPGGVQACARVDAVSILDIQYAYS